MTAPIRSMPENKRESIAKQLRWKIYARDGFACRYCGRKPPDVELHVDHVLAVSRGGKNDEGNLVTACKDCNLSKSGSLLPEPTVRETRMVVPMENVAHVSAILEELPRTTTRLYEFLIEEAKRYDDKGHPVEVIMPTLVMATIDAAAYSYLRLASASRTKRDFMAMCAAVFDERRND